MFKRITTTLALGLGAALLVPSTALAAKAPTGLTYATTTTVFDTPTTATVAGLHFEESQFGEACAAFDLTVIGSFQYWTGSEFVTMTQDPVPQRVTNCEANEAFRQDLATYYLNCPAGTFDLTRFTFNASPIYFGGSDGSTYIGSAPLAPLTLTAATNAQKGAICRLQAKTSQLSDSQLIAKLNKLLGRF